MLTLWELDRVIDAMRFRLNAEQRTSAHNPCQGDDKKLIEKLRWLRPKIARLGVEKDAREEAVRRANLDRQRS